MNWEFKKIKYICIAAVTASFLCACGDEIPEMTPEQTELITDYSAALLLKYDSNTPSRLLPVDQTNTIIVDLPGQAPVKEQAVNPNMNITDDVTPQVSSDDVTVTDTTDPSNNTVTEGEGFAGLVSDYGFDIQYTGYDILDSYPDGDGASTYFAIDASEGNKLLVVHFQLVSTTGADVDVDMNQINAKYRVAVNGNKTKKIMNTLLANDLLSYVGKAPAGSGTELVAIAEISEADASEINSLQFSIRGDQYNATINLE